MNRRYLLPLFALSLFAAPAWAADAAKDKEADDSAKARRASLEDKIAPVSGNLFLKDSRFEITPNLGLSLGDAFFQKYIFGLKLNYHFTETLSAGLHASYALNTPGSQVVACKSDGSCGTPTMDELNAKSVPGKLGILGGVEVGWSPLYGKVNLIAEKVLHFDTGLVLGIDAIGYEAPSATAGAANEQAFTVGGHIGISERIFITPSVTLRLELRDYIYSGKTITLGDSSSKIENQLMFELGLSFFVGGSR